MKKHSTEIYAFSLETREAVYRSPLKWTQTMIKLNQTTERKLIKMFILLFIIFIGIPLLKESMENQNYREQCRRRGDKTYWSTDGLRYTDTNQKVYK